MGATRTEVSSARWNSAGWSLLGACLALAWRLLGACLALAWRLLGRNITFSYLDSYKLWSKLFCEELVLLQRIPGCTGGSLTFLLEWQWLGAAQTEVSSVGWDSAGWSLLAGYLAVDWRLPGVDITFSYLDSYNLWSKLFCEELVLTFAANDKVGAVVKVVLQKR